MGFGRHKDLARRPWRLSAKLLIVSSVATVIGFSAICASVMADMRRGEEELARQTLENLASGIDADISRNVELYDLSLRAVASSMVMPELKDVSKTIRHLILFDHAATAKHFGAIQVFDAEGRLTIDASTLDPVPEIAAPRNSFWRSGTTPIWACSSAVRCCIGAYSIVLSRRITGDDGSFHGVVAGSIRFSYFHDLFGRLHLGPEDTITVLSRDGTSSCRRRSTSTWSAESWPPARRDPGAVGNQRIVFRNGRDGRDTAAVHLARRHKAAGRSGRQALEHILSLWRTEATRIGALMMALIVFVLAVTLFLAREIGRRAQAEDKLEELATTDALTGLKNRRKFDAEIDTEWRRAARREVPLALLMIDADHFKAYNDTFGHQAGDQMLVGIAICISDSVNRRRLRRARYGGEEFAVLLPGCAAADAMRVAEIIRLKVQEWSEATTVSIGVASLTPVVTVEWSMLVTAADKALYAAKANGRNRCVVATAPQLSLVA